MSIGDGVKIKLTFDQPLMRSSVDGLYPIPAGGYRQAAIDLSKAAVAAKNVYSSSYPAANVKDGSTSTYWRGTTQENYLRFTLSEPKVITSFRVYMSSYYAKTLSFYGSEDGSNWVDLTGVLDGSTGTSKWYEFDVPNQTAYKYYRVNTLTGSSTTQIYIYEVELCESVPVGNEKYFTVTVPKLDYSTGVEQTVDSVKTVESVKAFCTVGDILDLSTGVYDSLISTDNVLAFASASTALTGVAEYAIEDVGSVSEVLSSLVTWEQEAPEGSTVRVLAKLNDGEYTECENGKPFPFISEGSDLTNGVLYVKIEMERTATTEKPSITDLYLEVLDVRDPYSALLTLPIGNQNSIQNAVGDVTVHYDGHGFIRGEGGGVQPFDFAFTPTALTYKGDQWDEEHIEISDITAEGNLIAVQYTDVQSGDEHIEISNITAVGVLTHIDDI